MFRKSLLVLAGALALLSTVLVPVSADDGQADAPESAQGVSPDADRDGAPTGYYIGRDGDGGIALRTHGPSARHHFTAVLRTDGTFVDVESVRFERGDAFRISDSGHTLRYDVHSFDGVDGVNFRVRDGNLVTFRLELNDELISTDHIFLGQDGLHPAHNPFRLGQ
ncbi:MAG: hypothetical protein U0360_03540 [Dehalococcoidia bacterium]